MDMDQIFGGAITGGGVGFHPFAILFILIAICLLASGANGFGAIDSTGKAQYVSPLIKIFIAAGLTYLGWSMMFGPPKLPFGNKQNASAPAKTEQTLAW